MADGTCRRPQHGKRFSWGKVLDERFITYRLFRRSLQRRVHVHAQSFPANTPRGEIARKLKAMRRQLLDEVDAIDLRYLGVTEEAA